MKNFGLLQEVQANPKDWRFGSFTGIIPEVLEEDGNWNEYLPVYEPQRKDFDTMSCVSFSALNCLETLYKRRYDIEENFSDRFIAKASGTTLQGNYLSTVAETIRTFGLVGEEFWPFEAKTWVEYMKDLPLEVLQAGQDSLARFKLNWEWVVERDAKSMIEALTYSPLQVTVYAWEKPVNGIYPRTEKTTNHAVMLYGYKKYEYWLIYDHYSNNIKKLSWDFYFGHRLRYNIEDYMPTPKFEDNMLVQDAQDSGEFGMTLDGKIMVGDLSEIQATTIMRSKKKIIDGEEFSLLKTKALTKEEWDESPKINTKKEAV